MECKAVEDSGKNCFEEVQLLALILRARVILVGFVLSEVGGGGVRDREGSKGEQRKAKKSTL